MINIFVFLSKIYWYFLSNIYCENLGFWELKNEASSNFLDVRPVFFWMQTPCFFGWSPPSRNEASSVFLYQRPVFFWMQTPWGFGRMPKIFINKFFRKTFKEILCYIFRWCATCVMTITRLHFWCVKPFYLIV